MIILDGLTAEIINSPSMLLGAGILIGLYHALEPDHMAAIMTLAARQKRKGASRGLGPAAHLRNSLYGFLWGLGHTSAILLVIIAVFVFSVNIPPHAFAWFEFAVGAVLIAFGVAVYLDRYPGLRHSHPHTHEDGTMHSHPHRHDRQHGHGHKSYIIGCIHGLAGSGGLIILMAPTADSVHASLLFASVFGAGSIIGMMVVAGIMSLVFVWTGNMERVRRAIRYAVSVVAVSLGAYVMYGVVATDGGSITGLFV